MQQRMMRDIRPDQCAIAAGMIPQRTNRRGPRLGTVDEIADAVLWLCSDNAVTIGHALIVDGGQTV